MKRWKSFDFLLERKQDLNFGYRSEITQGGENIGILRWIAAGTAAVIVGPLAVPILLAGNWDGIDGYDGGCDE